MSVTVYGASDDLIEVEGALREEFSALDTDNDQGSILAFSNGVVLRVTYSKDGVWRIAPLAGGSRVTIDFAPTDDDDNYSDRARITEDVSWVVHGKEWAHK